VIDTEILTRLAKRCDSSTDLVAAYKLYETKKLAFDVQQRRLLKLEQDYKDRKAEINTEVQRLRSECDHPAELVQYHPDPSGNNDSSETCLLCGYEAKRIRPSVQPSHRPPPEFS
jgi:hypothetical protein